MLRSLSLAMAAFGLAAPAFAQPEPSEPLLEEGGSGVVDGDWAMKLEAVLVGTDVETGLAAAPAADGLMASVLVELTREDTFDNGLTVGWLFSARYERDAASRPAFAGAFGTCPAANLACPRIAAGGVFASPVSLATGLAAGGALLDEAGLVALEGAAVMLIGPWGEGVAGVDVGVATRLDARPPSVMRRVSVLSTGLDPTGLSLVRSRNDVTGSSPKLSYLSPRWLGVRVGASYAPDASLRSADFDPEAGGPGLVGADVENVWEGAVSFARQFAEQDLRVRAAITYSNADTGSNADAGAGLAAFGGYEAWGAGLELEHAGWTGGVRWLSSNNAWKAGSGDYEAVEAGLVHQTGPWRYGVEAGWAEDGLTGLKGSSWLAGVSYDLDDHVSVGFAWAASDSDLSVAVGPGLGHTNARNDGLLVELSVRN